MRHRRIRTKLSVSHPRVACKTNLRKSALMNDGRARPTKRLLCHCARMRMCVRALACVRVRGRWHGTPRSTNDSDGSAGKTSIAQPPSCGEPNA